MSVHSLVPDATPLPALSPLLSRTLLGCVLHHGMKVLGDVGPLGPPYMCMGGGKEGCWKGAESGAEC